MSGCHHLPLLISLTVLAPAWVSPNRQPPKWIPVSGLTSEPFFSFCKSLSRPEIYSWSIYSINPRIPGVALELGSITAAAPASFLTKYIPSLGFPQVYSRQRFFRNDRNWYKENRGRRKRRRRRIRRIRRIRRK